MERLFAGPSSFFLYTQRVRLTVKHRMIPTGNAPTRVITVCIQTIATNTRILTIVLHHMAIFCLRRALACLLMVSPFVAFPAAEAV
jgi:hypothetical protein